ncbi:SMS [Lepeophtheirus salmonis]|uniref:SMS n=1 Tax=Lepeophtheirus salmonis TaxID=72036 RepID=A0A7R8GYX8_LEPSM|nr:SMS [Lepeophtheirus salmonis]CAF2754158.1 SMS [Lepeophtheirus salmonis]
MTVKTILLDFRLKKNLDQDVLDNKIISTFEEYFKISLFRVSHNILNNFSQIWIYSDKDSNSPFIISIKSWDNTQEKEISSILTMNIEYSSKRFTELLTCDVIELEKRLTECFPQGFCDKAKSFPVIERGLEFSDYLTTSDNRIVQYNYERVLFSQSSIYQDIMIVDTIDHGRMLLLDDLVNLAENDTSFYTQSLMFGNDFDEILDNYKPAFVTMIDIDELVIKAVKEHMPSVCGEYFNDMQGSNYEVIIGDAFQYMEERIKERKTYDFIFGDLTDTPVPSSSNMNEIGIDDKFKWDLICSALSKSIRLLKPAEGKYLTHCNGKSVPLALKTFENLVTQKFNCSYERKETFVPSFMEIWVFYEVSPSAS